MRGCCESCGCLASLAQHHKILKIPGAMHRHLNVTIDCFVKVLRTLTERS
jgi:hypothetical protein